MTRDTLPPVPREAEEDLGSPSPDVDSSARSPPEDTSAPEDPDRLTGTSRAPMTSRLGIAHAAQTARHALPQPPNPVGGAADPHPETDDVLDDSLLPTYLRGAPDDTRRPLQVYREMTAVPNRLGSMQLGRRTSSPRNKVDVWHRVWRGDLSTLATASKREVQGWPDHARSSREVTAGFLRGLSNYFHQPRRSPGTPRFRDSQRDSRWLGRWNEQESEGQLGGDFSHDDRFFPEGHDHQRAMRRWRRLRIYLMAIGVFQFGSVKCMRARELSAAEVKRGLHKDQTGGQNVIPNVDFCSVRSEGSRSCSNSHRACTTGYWSKSTDDSEITSSRCELFFTKWLAFSPATVHRMLKKKLSSHDRTEMSFTREGFWTTMLFADISGFTRLSARIKAEKLKTYTNQYFTMLIDVVARYGGDVVKFCGDAVMIIWPSNEDAPRGVVQVYGVS